MSNAGKTTASKRQINNLSACVYTKVYPSRETRPRSLSLTVSKSFTLTLSQEKVLIPKQSSGPAENRSNLRFSLCVKYALITHSGIKLLWEKQFDIFWVHVGIFRGRSAATLGQHSRVQRDGRKALNEIRTVNTGWTKQSCCYGGSFASRSSQTQRGFISISESILKKVGAEKAKSSVGTPQLTNR